MSNSNHSKGSQPADNSRRNWIATTAAAGAAGGAVVAFPLVSTFAPSEKAKAAGAPVELDIGDLKPGEMKVGEWRGKPVWVVRRTPAQMDSLAKTEPQVADPKDLKPYSMDVPEYCKNAHRSRAEKKEFLVAIGICSHLGCSPSSKFDVGAQPSLPADWQGGFLCPCHGSTFDLAGRVYKNKPAPNNLDIPRHMFVGEGKLLVGKDEKGEA
jgi:ubiquinol-cytochrome c reductase iron-sulfur subunit